MTNKSRLSAFRRTMGANASVPPTGRSSGQQGVQVQTQQTQLSDNSKQQQQLLTVANNADEQPKSTFKKPAPLNTNVENMQLPPKSPGGASTKPISPRNRTEDKQTTPKNSVLKEDKVRVGYGPIAWIRHSTRQTSRVPVSNFALLSRLPVSREGNLIRLAHWSTGWKEAEIKMVVKSCYALVFHTQERQRRRSWGSAPEDEEETIPIPDRVLILRGAVINRPSTSREEFELKCADGTSLTFRASDSHSRDAWVAALDRAVRQGDAQLSDFETYAKLARGHFGTVQLVKHIRTGTALALKTIEMKPKKPEKQYHERAILELLQSGRNGPSPFVAKLCFAFRDSSSLYLATELASGGDLWALLRKRRRLLESTCRFISAELVLAVRHVHSHGVLHRDIKLENLLLDGQGHVKLVDFGLSKRLFDPATGLWDGRTFTVCGTNYYMPPEMLKKEHTQGHGLAADWWQVGCLIYELIAGAPAFYEKGARNIHKKILDTGGAPPFPSSLREVPSRACVDIVDKFLQHDPLKRLGKGHEDGSVDIMGHPFYREIDWVQLSKRRIEPTNEIKVYLKGESEPPQSPKNQSDEHSLEPKSDDLDEEGMISRAFPESELFDKPRRSASKYRRIRSLPTLTRLSSVPSFTTGLSVTGENRAERSEPLAPVDLGPYLGYEYAIDDNGLADARRGSGLILSRWRGSEAI